MSFADKIAAVQVSDTTKDESSDAADLQKNIYIAR